jgi:glycine oxidase
MQHPDICIAGAGVIGLSLALELHRRGARVTVLETGVPLAQASTAAAGMLAANDPDNLPALQPLADLSLSLYPGWLAHLEELSGISVPFHTELTLQSVHPPRTSTALSSNSLSALLPQLEPGAHRFIQLPEHSLDPRELAAALLAAVQTTSIDLRPHTAVHQVRSHPDHVEVHTPTTSLDSSQFVDCTGAWANSFPPRAELGVTPRKGQMLAVALPPSLPLNMVVRTSNIYIVPRTRGEHAGCALIGATVEDVGFDKTVHSADIAALQALAANLLPSLANATVLDSWAGLRPGSPDGLPLLGRLPEATALHSRRLLATGHFRNGLLLAPATARLMAQLLLEESTAIDLKPFSPARLLTPASVAH